MKIESVRIYGFKSFGEEQEISFNNMTCFIGNNSSGKTATLEALGKIFGDTLEQRTIKKSDFYVNTEDESDVKEKNLFIDVKFSFPDINDSTPDYEEIPLTFRYMTIASENSNCFCRMRFEAKWIDNNTTEGLVESHLFWVKSNDLEPKDEDKERVTSEERNYIRIIYIPAVRNPEIQIRNSAGSVIRHLFNAIQWDDSFKSTIINNADTLKQSFQSVEGIQTVQKVLKDYWEEYTDKNKYNEIILTPIDIEIESILRQIKAYFIPNGTENYDSTENLSDGNKSLFYFTLLNTLFKIENDVSEGKCSVFSNKILQKPLLTIFAIEEPENHLAPHYLGRIIQIFRDMNNLGTQTIITSHSPSIVKRINPEEIRYFKLNNQYHTKIKTILLPDNKLEEAKYVKRAVKAYPEIYFSKLVILGEGDSEEFVLPKLAEIYGINIDKNFVSIVPLAGRFVHHYWKLLNDLEINFITLLDLDKGRKTGGKSKIVYVKGQLEKINKIDDKEKKFLGDENIPINEKIEFLKTKNVFFSAPIDLDFYMLSNYFVEYTKILPNEEAPEIPEKEDADYENKCKDAIGTVLKIKEKNTIDVSKIEGKIEYYFWYDYLFLHRGKPVSHINGLSNIDEKSILEKEIFKDLFNKVKEYLK